MKMPEITTSNALCLEEPAHAGKASHDHGAIWMPEGIPGFPALRQAVFQNQPGIEPFFYLRALHYADLVFVCVEPFAIYPDYAVTISDAFAESLDLHSPRDVWMFSLVTLTANREDITANLMCPVVVNINTRKARQLIMEDAEHLLRFRIWDSVISEDCVAEVG